MITNCDFGPAGPQGPAGKDIQIVDSIRISSNNKLKIPANKQWISSNVNVSMGDKILMKASGEITINGEVFDPNGSSGIGGLSYPLPNRPVYSLFFKIGNSDVTKAGRSYFGFANDSGEIKFFINVLNELSDSAGYFTIDSLVTYSEK
jgi:hypothetical protein